ncbi:serine hydrolase domain-containing protein [Nocardiopsis ganjiahuensis]|uniref:serine hydrolase domain-containing protein n=1 Tax=Nocardiopsis ganjiahuensis TaxID=239984 RepID=UPI000347E5A8|nr:serine hydrolase domain-containing protein [Nocardiopsis ganjiahuensis]
MRPPSPAVPEIRSGGAVRWTVTTLAVVLAAVAAFALTPRPYTLDPRTSGDQRLAERVRDGIGDTTGYHGLSVALVEPDPAGGYRVRTAALGSGGGEPVDEHTPFGSASVAKVLPGMLLADMVDRGEVALDTTVGELLPDLDFADPAVADITAAELATHTSGLSREETSLPQTLWQFVAKRHPDPPASVDAFLRSVARNAVVDPGPKGANSYSNTGFSLLGHGLAARAGTDYAALVEERILDPLGMEDTAVRVDGEDTAADPRVHNADLGRPLELDRWEANGPQGGLTTTAGDLGLLLAAVMDGSAPGAWAADPVGPGDVERREQGLGWYVETLGGTAITSHGGNATTNGHTAWIGYSGDRGAVVLSNTHRFSEDIGIRLLGVDEPSPDNVAGERVYETATVAVTLLPVLLWLGFAARRRPGRRLRRPADRLGLVSYGLVAVALLAYAHAGGFWHLASPWVWTAGVLLAAAAAIAGVHRWADLPTARGRRPWARLLLTAPFALAGTALLLAVATL